jgi:hypothetical protein
MRKCKPNRVRSSKHEPSLVHSSTTIRLLPDCAPAVQRFRATPSAARRSACTRRDYGSLERSIEFAGGVSETGSL